MAIGDDALADGMDLVSGTADRRNGWQEINKTRDYIVQRIKSYLAALWPLPIAKGGTGADTSGKALAALGAWGNSGAVAAGQYPKLGWNGQRLLAEIPGYASPFEIARLSDVNSGSYLPTSGGTVSGDIYLPNSSAATSGYTIAYINGDGRISRGASSERYKEKIEAIDPASLGDLFPILHRYQMRDGRREWKYGYIAERLHESDDLRPFVVYDAEERPDSIDFIALLIAQVAQLRQENDIYAQRLDRLEGNA
ncbi:hypothetical protein [uncultured Microbacterium sp.]|uniref:hypothetical protein n=1 Tax=uncultured Microbacterium sp. TaxID=191216 RepID=UPI0025D4F7B0|nr:hypothetical protein [uncultured Microbacterium sp.]